MEGPVRKQCENCGEVHSYCPQCDNRFEDTKFMENGQWSIGYVDVDDVDYICAEWGSENCRVYLHAEE